MTDLKRPAAEHAVCLQASSKFALVGSPRPAVDLRPSLRPHPRNPCVAHGTVPFIVCVSRFYETDSSIKIGLMDAFAKLAVHPDSLPDIIFASIGRTVWKVGAQGTGSCSS